MIHIETETNNSTQHMYIYITILQTWNDRWLQILSSFFHPLRTSVHAPQIQHLPTLCIVYKFHLLVPTYKRNAPETRCYGPPWDFENRQREQQTKCT